MTRRDGRPASRGVRHRADPHRHRDDRALCGARRPQPEAPRARRDLLLATHVVQAEIAAEPGFYLRTPTAESRVAGVRTVARLQANLNLRASRFWLYGRTTAGLRLRGFDERDSFRELIVRRELWVEQATALLIRVNDPSSPGRAAFWAYGEYTVGRVASSGSPAATTAVTMPNRLWGGAAFWIAWP